ncbi:MAG TPA: hypothetical protein VMY76_00600 [Gemmatimonadales bacterium]|nr:hypothetical protein [Gemmatimonadales bacterium]
MTELETPPGELPRISTRHAQECGYDRLPFMRLLVDWGCYTVVPR